MTTTGMSSSWKRELIRKKWDWGLHSMTLVVSGGLCARERGSIWRALPRKRRKCAQRHRWRHGCATPRPLRQLEVFEIANEIATSIREALHERVHPINSDLAELLPFLELNC